MTKLNLSIAVRDYDRVRPLMDGTVQIDGVDPVFLALEPEEIFFRAFRHAEFDICELSLSSSTVKTAQGDFAYVGVPAFVSRMFRHTSVYVRTDRVKKPADLKGRKVGVSEYQLTANVWVRALLEDEYGVKPSDIHWIRGGLEQAGRIEKIAITLPADVRLDPAPEGATLNAMLEAGEIDAFVGPRTPSCFEQGKPNIGWLFPDPMAAAKDYFKKTGIFPIMHMIGVRRALVEQHPWLPAAVLKAFTRAKSSWPCAAGRHLRQQGHAAVHRRAGEGRARVDGRGFLALRHPGEPQAARVFPRAASQAGAFVAAGQAGRAVSSDDVRELQAVKLSFRRRRRRSPDRNPKRAGSTVVRHGRAVVTAPALRSRAPGRGYCAGRSRT